MNFAMIRLRFPKDQSPDIVGLDHCSSSDFINAFNKGGQELHKTQEVVTLYGTVFDLAELNQHTNSTVTQTVSTVFMIFTTIQFFFYILL